MTKIFDKIKLAVSQETMDEIKEKGYAIIKIGIYKFKATMEDVCLKKENNANG